jgi:16S rRNA (uracil1498-N3)-methyltransferase
MTAAETARRVLRTPRFFVERLDVAEVWLSSEDARHAVRSLRLEAGQEILLGDGAGTIGRGRLLESSKDEARVEVLETARVEPPAPRVSVSFAPPANEGYRWAVQKLAELGVDECIVTPTTRSVRRVDEGVAARMHTAAREAAMQSRREHLMDLVAVGSFDATLRYEGALVLLSEDAEAHLRDTLPDDAARVRILVGPEGGFTEQELAVANEAGAAVVTLGTQILRTETAAVAGAALVLHRYGRLG